ncbi:tRNA (adenosine(37)-N6)-threonylcarbamoyltransferase complex dimerization subunit type 1 TsaB [Halanaerobium sp. Z-7514]|uniref:tRNA (Adenosine(37)-N6)-threonylcarbamoyltransferase complex dimerization subunit type 1 TsaB n=1 Tax=Halanaerobium polyolivorans TaxID=2886943 RepID=A0AAW4WV84_9FIRM|nr:tRNA (adenosine(37)-N6)-threonylcarbamoyltransferase complex dimerization subunit type 1 TsaB [Halanaerobium polyolivorans]MCC3145017.1 tRNA (adenosine(37)-N6)-threonylcarbamoyltransferase complex dimerization subunit type 1 TsaB [Halanaerobium polyolivorans]RQD70819.1 MAG: tRNA (adenosine(37)-N6)-threonylcarbamoyltransferase complex dimerization subunit type 1 TsaB [Halanaerobium sp. MSAO_Bac5]
MLILGIDTSTDYLALSLLEDNLVKAEYNLSLKRQHSEKLLPLMEELFQTFAIKAQDLDAIAVSIGPGSFTGLRIAITTAKMLGRIFDIPVKGISTLEIMAAGQRADYILTMLDARRARVYYSFYSRKKADFKTDLEKKLNLKELYQASSIKIEQLAELLSAYKGEEILLLGDKTDKAAEILKRENFNVITADPENNYPRSAVLARLGRDYINLGQEDDIYQLKPAYLKKPQAELNWQQKYGG